MSWNEVHVFVPTWNELPWNWCGCEKHSLNKALLLLNINYGNPLTFTVCLHPQKKVEPTLSRCIIFKKYIMLNNNQVMYSTLECDSTILRSVHGTIQNLMLIQIWQLYNNIKGTYKLSFPKEKRNINVPPETNADNEDLPTDNHTKLKATCIIFSGGNYSNRCYFFFLHEISNTCSVTQILSATY